MATKEEIKKLMEAATKHHHVQAHKKMDAITAGSKHLLMYMAKVNRPITAGEVSKMSGVSTARAAVVIKKLQEKKLVTRTVDQKDARKALISLTPYGWETIEKSKIMFERIAEELIDKIGFDDMLEYIEFTKRIREVVENVVCEFDKKES